MGWRYSFWKDTEAVRKCFQMAEDPHSHSSSKSVCAAEQCWWAFSDLLTARNSNIPDTCQLSTFKIHVLWVGTNFFYTGNDIHCVCKFNMETKLECLDTTLHRKGEREAKNVTFCKRNYSFPETQIIYTSFSPHPRAGKIKDHSRSLSLYLISLWSLDSVTCNFSFTKCVIHTSAPI